MSFFFFLQHSSSMEEELHSALADAEEVISRADQVSWQSEANYLKVYSSASMAAFKWGRSWRRPAMVQPPPKSPQIPSLMRGSAVSSQLSLLAATSLAADNSNGALQHVRDSEDPLWRPQRIP